jgi:hypothetical protein
MTINPLKGQALINLGGKDYKARLTIDAIIKIETALDKGILQITQKLSDGDVRLNDVCVILYHALRGGSNDLEMSEIRRIVQNTGIVPSITQMTTLLVGLLNDDSSGEDAKKDEGTS